MTTTPSLQTPIDHAVEVLVEQFAGHVIDVVRDSSGDVLVVIDDVHVGDQYEPSRTWFGFRISSAYPNADVYPHYLGRVVRRDGRQHGSAMQQVLWLDRDALQLSRRSNGWNPRRDTASLKAAKVLAWFADQ